MTDLQTAARLFRRWFHAPIPEIQEPLVLIGPEDRVHDAAEQILEDAAHDCAYMDPYTQGYLDGMRAGKRLADGRRY